MTIAIFGRFSQLIIFYLQRVIVVVLTGEANCECGSWLRWVSEWTLCRAEGEPTIQCHLLSYTKLTNFDFALCRAQQYSVTYYPIPSSHTLTCELFAELSAARCAPRHLPLQPRCFHDPSLSWGGGGGGEMQQLQWGGGQGGGLVGGGHVPLPILLPPQGTVLPGSAVARTKTTWKTSLRW